MKKNKQNINGILVLNKDTEMSSNRALQKVKGIFQAKKAGHTGSLDPLATGVLPICFGEATKFSQFLLNSDKTYQVTGVLGISTDTGDSTGEVIKKVDGITVTQEKLLEVVKSFKGDILQVPPMYSALKHQGQPLYKMARKGIEISRKARKLTIHEIKLLSFINNQFSLEVACSKGTYIRTLVEDIGNSLGVGAHVIQLHRIQAGIFNIEQSYNLASLDEIKNGNGDLLKLLQPLDIPLTHLPEIFLSEDRAKRVKNGQIVSVESDFVEKMVRLYDQNHIFMGLAEIKEDYKLYPKRLLSHNESFLAE